MSNKKNVARRVRLPDERNGLVHRFTVGGVRIYVNTGEYEDGALGEVFLKADKQGSFTSGVADGLSIILSVALQHGVPLEAFTDKLKNTRFEPEGMVEGGMLPDEPTRNKCTSVLDYLARWLESRYGKKKDGAS